MCYSYTSGYRSIHWCIVHLPGATPLKKTNSPSPSSYQLPMATELWLLLHVHLPSPCWDCFWIELMQVLWMLSQPLSVQTYNCAVVSVNAALLLWLSLSSLSSPYTTSGSYSLVFSLFCNELWGKGMIWMPHLGQSISWSLILFTLITSRTVLIDIYFIKNFLWCVLIDVLIYGYYGKSSRISLILCLFTG